MAHLNKFFQGANLSICNFNNDNFDMYNYKLQENVYCFLFLNRPTTWPPCHEPCQINRPNLSCKPCHNLLFSSNRATGRPCNNPVNRATSKCLPPCQAAYQESKQWRLGQHISDIEKHSLEEIAKGYF